MLVQALYDYEVFLFYFNNYYYDNYYHNDKYYIPLSDKNPKNLIGTFWPLWAAGNFKRLRRWSETWNRMEFAVFHFKLSGCTSGL